MYKTNLCNDFCNNLSNKDYELENRLRECVNNLMVILQTEQADFKFWTFDYVSKDT